MSWVTEFAPTKVELDACVECGLCLPVCPTFQLTGDEAASPRGRLAAMRVVHEGTMVVDERFGEIMDFCLQCRACEVVCPSMVPFGRAMEGPRLRCSLSVPTPAGPSGEACLVRGCGSAVWSRWRPGWPPGRRELGSRPGCQVCSAASLVSGRSRSRCRRPAVEPGIPTAYRRGRLRCSPAASWTPGSPRCTLR